MDFDAFISSICKNKIWEKEYKNLYDLLVNGFLKIDNVPKVMFSIININLTSETILSKIESFLKIYDLSIPQKNVLEALYFSERDLSQNDLGKFVFSSKGNISTLIRRMEKKGLVERYQSPKCYKEKLVSITEKGKKLFIRVLKDINLVHKNLKNIITDEEAENLNKILMKIHNTFENIDIKQLVHKKKLINH